MKQYLLLLKSGDFNKSGNTWTSNAVNLYKNNSFTNYSYIRSRYGLNTIGDNTYVGLEYTSPSYTSELSTPLSNNALYVTDVGEIVYEQATPSILRFVDTTSKIDILAYRHAFTNLPGTEVPTFNLQMYESDSENGPWLKSVLSFDSNVIFIRDCKPWIKIELEIFTETLNVNDLGLLFYLEIGIHDPVSPVASEHARNILKRFPTWTDMFADSENPATPSLFVPSSTAGKFLTALVQETLDNFDNELNLYDINHYISSADENMLAWAYVSYDVPVNILKVLGDDIPLIQVDSLASFHRSQSTDYVYYYSQTNKQILCMREFATLKINDIQHDQHPLHIPNNFDEFGARVGLPRLLLESNSRYKKRILDVALNYPAAHIDGFKRTVRRELDIWKAYGIEPDSNYLGATPDVIEISDMEKSTPWFTPSGKPLKPFVDLIESINEKYPSNIGYVRWEEGYWDYGGMDGEGISSIPAIYDVSTSASPQYYQSGVGDYADAKLILEAEEKSTTSFSGYARISGVYADGIEEVYAPIKVDYSWYLSYLKRVPDYMAGRRKSGIAQDVGVGLTYEISMATHNFYATPSTFYVNLNYLNRDDFYVGNRLPENHPASPEYNLIKIFNDDGYTVSSLQFKDKIYNNIYFNAASSPSVNTINFDDVSSVKIVFSNGGWNYVTQTYDKSLATTNYRVAFSKSTPNTTYYTNPSYAQTAQLASPTQFSYTDANLKIGSTIYETKVENFQTQTITSSFFLNENNNLTQSGTQNYSIYINDLVDRLILPSQSTPQYIYIDNVKPVGLTHFNGDTIISDTYGGAVINPDDDERYLVPSSPNITYKNYFDKRTNLCTNPSFETNSAGWSSAQTSGARYNLLSFVGTSSYLITMGGTSDSNIAYTTIEIPQAGSFAYSLYVYTPPLSTLAGRTVSLARESGTAGVSSPVSSPATLVGGSWVRASVTYDVTEAGTAIMVARLSGDISTASGQSINIDATLAENSLTVGNYFDGSTHPNSQWTGTAHASTSIISGRGNMCTNPSFETNTTGWAAYLATNVRTAGTITDGVGSWSMVTTATATGVGGAFFNFTPLRSAPIVASAQVLRTSGSRSYRIGIQFYNGATPITTIFGTAQTCSTSTLLTTSGTVPATATNAYILIYSSVSGAIGDAIQVDSVLLEYASTINEYFDGSTSSISSWTGTAHNSTSIIKDNAYYALSKSDYFDSATINYYATPSYLTFESASNNFYPIYFTKYSSFTSQTTPQLFGGYIDSLDNVYENSEEANNTFFNSDDFLKKIYLSKDSFNLNSEVDYIVKDVELISDTQYIEPYVNDKNSLMIELNNTFANNENADVDVRIARDIQQVVANNPAIHTGWLYLNEDEYYIYSNPITDSATGRFFSLPISGYPRSGSPIIVTVGQEQYRNILFEHPATPGSVVFNNTEDIYGNISNSIYLAYENVENVSVKDSYTGVTLFDNLSTSTNELHCFSDATPSVYGRKYTVNYDVKNAWYVDKNIYNQNTDSYESSIYFSSTPNTNQVYSITYESSLNDNSHSIDLSLFPSSNPIDEGFVYVSKTDYPFANAKAILSPTNISNLQDDLMYLTIISYDENNNFKPGQTFHVYGDIVSATPAYVTTNDNGIGKTVIRYSYNGSEIYESSNLYVSGIGSATPYGAINSETQGYVTSVPFNVNISDPEILRLKAAPSSLIINAGSSQSISIVGQVLWKNQPWAKAVQVSWSKARTLKDLFAATPDYTTYTSSDGRLEIANIATAQDSATPGYWFARVNISDEANVKNILLADQEINSTQDVTISGDVIYWYESYDTIQYDQELSPPLPNIYTLNKQQNSDIIATPNFVYKHSDSNTIVYSSATPNWTPPRWVPLRKYDQYQMGIFGSTPNHISDYELVHPDHEEQ